MENARMLTSTYNELADQTLVYWKISQCRFGRSNTSIATFMAIDLMNNIVFSFNPARPLVKSALNLREDIIEDEPSPPIDCRILSFEELAKHRV